MYINLYFQFDEPNYEGYQPNWHELFKYKKWKHPNEEFCRKDEKKTKRSGTDCFGIPNNISLYTL